MAGRPTKLSPAMIAKARKYLKECQDTNEIIGESGNRHAVVWTVKLPTIEGLAVYLGVNRSSIYEWQTDADAIHLQFSNIIDELQASQADRLINNGLAGTYNSTIAKVLMTKHGYVEKTEVKSEHSGAVTFVNDIPRPPKAGDDQG